MGKRKWILSLLSGKICLRREPPYKLSQITGKSKAIDHQNNHKSCKKITGVFTETNEIALLKTLSQSPNNNDLRTGYFTYAQIAYKLKKLKEKYHKFARSKSQIKTPHDCEIYEIGRKIWGRNAAKGKELLVVEEEDHDEDEDDVNLEDFSFLVMK
ncbi:hypothetical protein KY290_000319 [Solanum tuberosum]|uniref:Uncharacterized protein n=1 Tax=Solanum tuberosum TaxID=4113 RepID=A0ABQ7WKF3_SOLTU|nr:hypothetical protein KY290_000319 [Solanum tuberosum]